MAKFTDIIDGTNFDKSSWVLIYSYSEIILEKLGALTAKVKDMDMNNIIEARFFNENDELKIWKYQGDTKARLFSKSRQDDYQEYEEVMLLWGNRVENNILKESGTGAEISFPLSIAEEQLPFKIHVNNYYTFDENGLIQFQDARLVKITDKNDMEVQ